MLKYIEKMYKGSVASFEKLIEKNIINNIKMFIITANPETLIIAQKNKQLNKILLSSENTVISDGIGIVKAGEILKIKFEERIPGIEVATKLLEYGNEYSKTAYFLGGTEQVAVDFKNKIIEKYPNLKIVGSKNGYFDKKEEIFDDIIKKEPDIILVGLGIPKQELLISEYLPKFKKGIFVGVGGSFDVLSGNKKRAPKIFIKLNLEWLYRLIKEPSRIKRFYNNNIKFIFEIKKIKR